MPAACSWGIVDCTWAYQLPCLQLSQPKPAAEGGQRMWPENVRLPSLASEQPLPPVPASAAVLHGGTLAWMENYNHRNML